MTAEPAAATRHTATYPGRAGQLRHVRSAVASHLTGCAAADDAVLVASVDERSRVFGWRSAGPHTLEAVEIEGGHLATIRVT